MSKISTSLFLGIAAAFLMAGCASTSFIINRGAFCEDLAVKNGFTKEIIRTDDFTLLAYTRFREKGGPVNIYIEGDGLAWKSRSRLSEDPTPKNTLVVELASIDPAPNIAYLARPGQYIFSGASVCDSAYWSDKKFSEEVIGSMNEAVEHLKIKSGAKSVNIIGYSGGAAVGVLIAARRGDVASLRTIAGNLDPDSLNRYHHVSVSAGSLNPIDFAKTVSNTPQRHFIGSADKTVPAFIAESFAERAGDVSHKRVTKVEGATHGTGWREEWLKLLSVPPQ